MSDTLKNRLIRLGRSSPELKKHLRPIIDQIQKKAIDMRANNPIDYDWSQGGDRRIKIHPEAAEKGTVRSAINPDIGDVVPSQIQVSTAMNLPVDLRITGKGDPWNSGKEQWAYGDVDWTPAIDMLSNQLPRGQLTPELEEKMRSRLGNLEPREVETLVDGLK